MKMALVQMDCVVGDVDANRAKIAAFAKQAAQDGCDVAVFPEMADTGYDMAVISRCATPWDSGTAPFLADLAAQLGISIICGLAEREGDRLYNAVAVVDESGQLVGKYRKTHLFTTAPVCEQDHLTAGETCSLVKLGTFTVGIMICYDLRFPELARALALGGAELIVIPAAWPANRASHFKLLSACRAIENQLYVAACNRTGTDQSLVFGGCSQLVDPYGIVLAEDSTGGAGMLVGEIDHERIARTRKKIQVFRDRRPDLYTRLSDVASPYDAG